MEFLSSMYRGLPTDTTKSVYGASPDMLTSGVGLLGAAGGFKRGGLTGGLGGLYMRDR
jgi:hypothetical protein